MKRDPDGELDTSADDGPGPGSERSVVRGALSRVRAAFVDNAALKFVALVLSLTVFILVHSDEEAVTSVTVDVSYTLPPGKVLISQPVEQLRLTVKGTRRRVRRFDKGELERINVDLRGRGDGELVFERDMISGLPDGLELASITPASIDVELADRVERLVPVEIETVGQPVAGFVVTRREAVPAQVALVGTSESISEIEAVRTRPIALDGLRRRMIEEVTLVAPAGTELATERVRVEVDVEEVQSTRELGPLPIVLHPAGVSAEAVARLEVKPHEVEVVLRGTLLDVQRVVPGALQARVVVTAADLTAGGRELEVRLVPPLAGIGIEIRPPTVTVRAP